MKRLFSLTEYGCSFCSSIPTAKPDTRNASFKEVTFHNRGATHAPDMIWSGDVLVDLQRYQALKVTPKTINGTEFLFIEAVGFNSKNPVGCKLPLIAMKRSARK